MAGMRTRSAICSRSALDPPTLVGSPIMPSSQSQRPDSGNPVTAYESLSCRKLIRAKSVGQCPHVISQPTPLRNAQTCRCFL